MAPGRSLLLRGTAQHGYRPPASRQASKPASTVPASPPYRSSSRSRYGLHFWVPGPGPGLMVLVPLAPRGLPGPPGPPGVLLSAQRYSVVALYGLCIARYLAVRKSAQSRCVVFFLTPHSRRHARGADWGRRVSLGRGDLDRSTVGALSRAVEAGRG